MDNRWLMLRQLTRQLKEWQSLNEKYGKPKLGWLKAIRMSLNMTEEQFAQRSGVTRSSISQLETAEVEGTVSLNTLNKFAASLNCELIYAIVPKGACTLEDIIKARAEELASKEVARVAHSMSLEAQSINENELKQQQEDLAQNLFEHFNKRLWVNDEPSQEKLKITQKAKHKKERNKK